MELGCHIKKEVQLAREDTTDFNVLTVSSAGHFATCCDAVMFK
jgi:hypothetical protein